MEERDPGFEVKNTKNRKRSETKAERRRRRKEPGIISDLKFEQWIAKFKEVADRRVMSIMGGDRPFLSWIEHRYFGLKVKLLHWVFPFYYPFFAHRASSRPELFMTRLLYKKLEGMFIIRPVPYICANQFFPLMFSEDQAPYKDMVRNDTQSNSRKRRRMIGYLKNKYMVDIIHAVWVAQIKKQKLLHAQLKLYIKQHENE